MKNGWQPKNNKLFSDTRKFKTRTAYATKKSVEHESLIIICNYYLHKCNYFCRMKKFKVEFGFTKYILLIFEMDSYKLIRLSNVSF